MALNWNRERRCKALSRGCDVFNVVGFWTRAVPGMKGASIVVMFDASAG